MYLKKSLSKYFYLTYLIERYTIVTELVDVIVRLIDVTADSFHLQDVGI